MLLLSIYDDSCAALPNIYNLQSCLHSWLWLAYGCSFQGTCLLTSRLACTQYHNYNALYGCKSFVNVRTARTYKLKYAYYTESNDMPNVHSAFYRAHNAKVTTLFYIYVYRVTHTLVVVGDPGNHRIQHPRELRLCPKYL